MKEPRDSLASKKYSRALICDTFPKESVLSIHSYLADFTADLVNNDVTDMGGEEIHR